MLPRRKIMKQYIAVFKSKTDVFGFIERMKSYGFYTTAVSTPKEAHQGCGLSALFPANGIYYARNLINGGAFKSFYGIFVIESDFTRRTTRRIY